MLVAQWCYTIGLLMLLTAPLLEASHGRKTFKERKLIRPPRTQNQFVTQIRLDGHIKSDIVHKTLCEIDRKYYIPGNPYVDGPKIVPKLRQLDSPAHMHAFALEVLQKKLKPGNRALDVGCGFGYLTACMSMMVGMPGLVVGLDTNLQQIQNANRSYFNDKFLQGYYVDAVYVGELAKGYPKLGPYDAIFVTPAAKEVPQDLLDQLNINGKMVIPIGEPGPLDHLCMYEKDVDGDVSVRKLKGNFFPRRSLYPTPLPSVELYYDESDD